METKVKEAVIINRQKLAQVKCRISILKCFRSSEKGGDEVFLKINQHKIWPRSPYVKIKQQEEQVIDLEVLTDSRGFVRIDLWDKDFFIDDLLGFFQFNVNGGKGKFTTDLTPCTKEMAPKYSLAWEV